MSWPIIYVRRSLTIFGSKRRKRFCHSKPKPTNRINGSIGDSNILHEFTDFYKRVGQPNTVDADDRYVNQIADYLQSHKNHSATVSPIDLAFIDDAVRNLPLRKAAGHDGIQNEHIIHAGPQLLVHLSLLFRGYRGKADIRGIVDTHLGFTYLITGLNG